MKKLFNNNFLRILTLVVIILLIVVFFYTQSHKKYQADSGGNTPAEIIYQVFGKVVDSDDHPMSGLRVYIGGVSEELTDGQGSYSVSLDESGPERQVPVSILSSDNMHGYNILNAESAIWLSNLCKSDPNSPQFCLPDIPIPIEQNFTVIAIPQ